MDRREMLRRTAGAAAGLWAVPRPGLRAAPGFLSDRPDLAVAERAAAWIASTRIEADDGVRWAWNPTERPDEAAESLYTGSPGVVLFLVELHAATGAPAHLADARRGADAMIATLTGATERIGAGLYTGLAGWSFVLDEVARATGDARYGEAARRADAAIVGAARPAGRGVEWDGTTDVVSGAAGTGLGLLRAHARTGDRELLRVAAAAARRLIEIGEPSHGGLEWYMRPDVTNRYPNFSHGTAGVAYFLATLHGVTGEAAFLDAARAGARYLGAVTDSAAGGCRIFHHRPGGEDLDYLSWCHGPAGTARLHRRLAELTGDPAFDARVACLARGIVETGAPERRTPGFWENVSQCCGDAGVGEFFLSLSARDPEPAWATMAERVRARLLAGAAPHAASGGLHWTQAEHRVRPEWTVPQTGFMQGAAGIGTFFLHLDGRDRGRAPAVRWPDSPWTSAA